ncbi:MAG: substrate-binding domain-containing protein [Verrucomicrobium sp.]
MHPAPLRPLRTSLVTETVKALRHGIESGLWSGYLPGERTLCSQWQISRPTLRVAVDLLRQEGLLEVGHGRRTRLLVHHAASRPSTLTVGLLSPEPLQSMPPTTMLWVDELRGQLAASGHLLQVTVGRAGFGKKGPAHALATVISDTPAAVWVLYQSTETMQRWFQEKGIPCVVVGSTFPGVQLPSVDRDYRAVCRHAVGTLVRRGHRRIAFLIHTPPFGGDLESEAGFQEGLAAAASRGIAGEVVHHDGTPPGICSALDALVAGRNRCTGLLVARTGYALTAITHLLRRGLRVPEDVAVLCRDDDSFLDWLMPSVSRYAVSPGIFAKQVQTVVLKLVEKGTASLESVKVMPTFVSRNSG